MTLDSLPAEVAVVNCCVCERLLIGRNYHNKNSRNNGGTYELRDVAVEWQGKPICKACRLKNGVKNAATTTGAVGSQAV